jgi:putative methionine-R-sulfoxide reductase with GAF domain
MKAIRFQTLQQKAIALVVVFAVLFAMEFLIITSLNNQWDQKERQLELTQAALFNAHQLSNETTAFLQGQKEKLAQVIVLTDRQDAQLKILSQGGLPEGSNKVVKPVSRLSGITLTHLSENWNAYKSSVLTLTTNEVWKDSIVTITNASDSLAGASEISQKIVNPAVAQARTLIDGQWITFTNRFNSLLKDLQDDKQQSESDFYMVLTGCLFINVLLIAALFILFNRKVIAPLKAIQQSASSRSLIAYSAKDEIGEVSKGLNQILEQLNHASAFVQSIGDGNLEVNYIQSNDQSIENDKLASSLVSMQSKLKVMNEEEQKRKWANEGLTKFVEILRTSDDNLHKLGDRIISTLIQYTRSNQGGLYILNDEDQQNKYLELISLYAFNTKKFEQQKLRLGEGLVGQAFLEKDTIYIKEIPEDYIRITSGLGESNPKAILVVPLKVDTEVYGLVELASFQEYHPHEIEFVQRIGETLASTLASVKTNQRNRKLLEDSKIATEAMQSQEEEMRQNMEELTATQEEMSRKERDYLSKIKELEGKAQQVVHGDDWAVASEMEKQMKINLDALKIAQEALTKKS